MLLNQARIGRRELGPALRERVMGVLESDTTLPPTVVSHAPPDPSRCPFFSNRAVQMVIALRGSFGRITERVVAATFVSWLGLHR
jgi:hypothetical protein